MQSYLRLAKDPRFKRLPCTHKGTYADDCIVSRVQMVVHFFMIALDSGD
jgi:U3 small nucleolar RNA-associated protein 24